MKLFFRSPLFLLLLAFPLLAACSDDHADDVPQPGSVKGRRTVILYMAAENSLGIDGYLRSDSTEVMKGRIWLANEDRLLMFIDDEKGSRLYRVTKQNNTPTLVHRWNRKLNAADSETLREVCQMTKEQFPAEEYGLVCWSHATGWIPPTPASTQNVPLKSFGLDRGNEAAGNSEMLIEDLAEAIEASGMHFTYIFFDCCLMQTIETAYALRHVTERVIAAPMSIAACGAIPFRLLERQIQVAVGTNVRIFLVDCLWDEHAHCAEAVAVLGHRYIESGERSISHEDGVA